MKGGVGACTQALKRLGIDVDVLDYVEIDKYAVKSYNAINGTNFETQDITQWNKHFDDVDLIMHGSPCQDFSLSGKQAGGDEGSGTRSSLMYETIRIVKDIKPKYVIWENVKNLLSKKHIHNFNAYLETMEQLGYTNYYQVLNAKDYGIPQNRERVFTISIRKDLNETFEFPPKQELKLKVKDLLEEITDPNLYLTPKNLVYILDGKNVALNGGRNINNRIINPDIAKTISCRGAVDQRADVTNFVVDGKEEITVKEAKDLISKDFPPNYNLEDIEELYRIGYDEIRIRKLSPRECWRLMGFSDESFDKAKEVNSNSQLYKQAGNSIVVNVLYEILKNLL